MNHEDTTESIQYFGFLPSRSISKLQSSEYQQRIESSQEILEYLPTIPIEDIDILEFLRFIESYVVDANLKVAQNCSLIMSEVLTMLKSGGTIPIHAIVHVGMQQIGDHRKFVSQLGHALIGDLLRVADPREVISEVIKTASSSNSQLQSQVFFQIGDYINNSIIDPYILIHFPYFFDAALLSSHETVRKAAVRCSDILKNSSPDAFEKLLVQLSRDSSKVIGKTSQNPSTAIPKTRPGVPSPLRPINTAGLVEMNKMTMGLSQKGYRRPAMPSSAGARKLLSLSRPVSSTFSPTTFDENSSTNSTPTFYDEETSSDNNEEGKYHYSPLEIPKTDFPEKSSFYSNEIDDEPMEKPSIKARNPFEDAVFENVSPSRAAFTKEPKLRTRKILGESEDHNVPPKTFSGGHFDENAFDYIPTSSVGKRHQSTSLPEVPFSIKEPDSKMSKRPNLTKPHVIQFDSPNSDEVDQGKNFNTDPDMRPINSSGSYGDTDDMNDSIYNQISLKKANKPTSNRRQKSIRLTSANKLAQTAPAPNPTKLTGPPPLSSLIEKLQSEEWSDQNDAIAAILDISDPNYDMIQQHLRNSVSTLLECAQSLRTMLAKNALNLLIKWVKTPQINFEVISDTCSTTLLKLQNSTHRFIVQLSGECFLALINSLPPSRAANIIRKEYKSPYAPSRTMLTNAAYQTVMRSDDVTMLLIPLAYLVKDADQNVRRFAKMAIKQIATKQQYFEQYIKNNVSNLDDQQSLIKASQSSY